MHFGDRLRKLRQEFGLTQRELANKLNLSHSTIGLYEQNRRDPEYNILCKLADLFDIDLDFLLGRAYPSKKNMNQFKSINEALTYVLHSNTTQKFADYDISKLSSIEINDFAHDLANFLKILAYKYKK